MVRILPLITTLLWVHHVGHHHLITEEGLASRSQHSHLSILRMLEIIWFYHVHYLIYYNRWGCDHPLNSVPGNGTGFPYTEKPRNQTLSSDCEAKVRRNAILTKKITLRLFRGL